jgi:hypothetical protein
VILTTEKAAIARRLFNNRYVSRLNIPDDISAFVDALNAGNVGAIIIEPESSMELVRDALEITLPNYKGTEFLERLKIVAPEQFSDCQKISTLVASKIISDSHLMSFL